MNTARKTLTDLPSPVFTIVPLGKENSEFSRLVGSEEAFGLLQRRNDFCDRTEETLLQVHIAFLDLLKAQPSVNSQKQAGVVPPHTKIAIAAHSQSLALRAEMLLQLIHELKVHIVTCLPDDNKNDNNISRMSNNAMDVDNV